MAAMTCCGEGLATINSMAMTVLPERCHPVTTGWMEDRGRIFLLVELEMTISLAEPITIYCLEKRATMSWMVVRVSILLWQVLLEEW